MYIYLRTNVIYIQHFWGHPVQNIVFALIYFFYFIPIHFKIKTNDKSLIFKSLPVNKDMSILN